MTDLGRFLVDSHGENGPGPREVAVLANRQHGVVARWQLTHMGLGEGAVDYWLRTGRMHRLHQGVYAVGHTVLGWKGRVMAAVLACGPERVASHRDALMIWDLRRSTSPTIDVTVPGRSRGRRNGIRVHRVRDLHPDDRTAVDGIPVTSLARTLLDMAGPRQRQDLPRL